MITGTNDLLTSGIGSLLLCCMPLCLYRSDRWQLTLPPFDLISILMSTDKKWKFHSERAIPVSLIRWQLTGKDEEIRAIVAKE
jgi:hypothetical protein